MKSALVLLAAGSAEAFSHMVLGGGAPLGRASCTPLRMSMADKFSSRRQLLQGATLAAAGNILPAFAEGGNAAPAPGELGYEGTTEAGVKFKILETTTALGDKVGVVETAKKGDFVILSLKATSADGKVLMDTSVDGKGFAVTLGKGKTILGLEDGVTGMKAGERRRLQIPAGELTDPIKQDVEVEVTFERKSGLMKFFNGN